MIGAALFRRLPPGQFVRYLAVGLWNTAFGYTTFALLTAALDRYIPHSYLAASLLSSVLSITVAYLGYKWFVFKTKGNYLREWGRAVAVYGSTILLGLALLPMLVFSIRRLGVQPKTAPYLAGAVVTGITVVVSFFGHRHISFKSPPRP